MSRTNKENMNLIDDLLKMFQVYDQKADLTYNKYHIALGGEGRKNYAWFHPRKSKYIRLRMRYLPEDMETAMSICEEAGLEVHTPKKQVFGVNMTIKGLKEHRQLIDKLIQLAKKSSK